MKWRSPHFITTKLTPQMATTASAATRSRVGSGAGAARFIAGSGRRVRSGAGGAKRRQAGWALGGGTATRGAAA
ncbi:hypothetical protein Acidovoranil_13190 [Acidovorax sp. FG27]